MNHSLVYCMLIKSSESSLQTTTQRYDNLEQGPDDGVGSAFNTIIF